MFNFKVAKTIDGNTSATLAFDGGDYICIMIANFEAVGSGLESNVCAACSARVIQDGFAYGVTSGCILREGKSTGLSEEAFTVQL